jgi:hypothetical protein
VDERRMCTVSADDDEDERRWWRQWPTMVSDDGNASEGDESQVSVVFWFCFPTYACFAFPLLSCFFSFVCNAIYLYKKKLKKSCVAKVCPSLFWNICLSYPIRAVWELYRCRTPVQGVSKQRKNIIFLGYIFESFNMCRTNVIHVSDTDTLNPRDVRISLLLFFF